MEADREREWWLRVPAVLLAPRSVFAALRDDTPDDLDARAEPVLALVLLAGVFAALASETSSHLYDDPIFDGALVIALWLVFAGAFTSFVGYFVVGGALYLGTRGLGSEGTFRRARHLLAFAVAPLALGALVVWPLALAVFGDDLFRRGGDDEGAGGQVLGALELGLGLWSAALLLLGVRTVHGWTWARSLASLGLLALFLAAARYVL